ncbi:MAG TPA: SH3 domain-containing protein [Trichocoleus sp.]
MVRLRLGLWILGTVLLGGSLGGCSRHLAPPTVVPTATPVPAASPVAQTSIPAGAGGTAIGVAIEPPRPAALKAERPDAEVNVRSQPTTGADSVGGGAVGEQVELLRLTEGEGGYTWYYARFGSGVEGWVRGDFIDLGQAASASVVTPVNCGEARQKAFFETRTYTVYICDTADGLRYIGTNKVTREFLTLTEVQDSQGTFVAINGSYQYHVNDGTLAVYQVNKGEYTQIDGEQVVKHQRSN